MWIQLNFSGFFEEMVVLFFSFHNQIDARYKRILIIKIKSIALNFETKWSDWDYICVFSLPHKHLILNNFTSTEKLEDGFNEYPCTLHGDSLSSFSLPPSFPLSDHPPSLSLSLIAWLVSMFNDLRSEFGKTVEHIQMRIHFTSTQTETKTPHFSLFSLFFTQVDFKCIVYL